MFGVDAPIELGRGVWVLVAVLAVADAAAALWLWQLWQQRHPPSVVHHLNAEHGASHRSLTSTQARSPVAPR